LLAALVGFAALIGIIAAATYTDSGAYQRPGFRKITMDHMFNGTFSSVHKSIAWVPEGEVALMGAAIIYSMRMRVAGDGVYSVYEDGYIKLVDLKTNTTQNLVADFDVKDVSDLLMRTTTGPIYLKRQMGIFFLGLNGGYRMIWVTFCSKLTTKKYEDPFPPAMSIFNPLPKAMEALKFRHILCP
jgi:hypothetical protein